MAGRPRKPTNLLELTGAFKKNPNRAAARAHEPKPKGPLGDPPSAFLNPESPTAIRQLQAWNELLEMVPPRVLTSADRWWCERAAKLMAESRVRTLKPSEESSLANYLSKMGCNPAARASMTAGSDPADDEGALDAFARKRKSG